MGFMCSRDRRKSNATGSFVGVIGRDRWKEDVGADFVRFGRSGGAELYPKCSEQVEGASFVSISQRSLQLLCGVSCDRRADVEAGGQGTDDWHVH